MSNSTGSPEPARPVFTEREIRSVFAGLMLAMLLGALDQTIVAVALPAMAADLRGVELLAWVVSAYLISAAIATPVFGKLGDLYGRRAILTAAIAIFLAGAAACATAQSMWVLVAARIVQGIGGGALVAVAQAAIADVVAPRERGRYQVYFSTVHVVASVAGPLAGGLLTQYLSWRWIFWLNLPLGVVALLVSRRALSRLTVSDKRRSIDYLGAILLAAGLGTLLVGVTRVGMGVPVFSPAQVGAYSLAAVVLAVFAWHEGRVAEPLLPLALFAIPTVRISCFILFVGFMQLVALTVLVPMRLQLLVGMPPGAAALQLMPLTLAGPCGAYLAGRLMLRTGRTRALQASGAFLVAAGLAATGLMAAPSPVIGHALLATIGVGIGLQFPTSLVAIQNAVLARQVGVATALAAFSRSLGAAIGLAVLSTVLLSLLGNVPRGGPAVPGAQAMRELAAATGSRTNPELLAVANSAFQTIFLLSAGIALLSFLCALRLPDQQLQGA